MSHIARTNGATRRLTEFPSRAAGGRLRTLFQLCQHALAAGVAYTAYLAWRAVEHMQRSGALERHVAATRAALAAPSALPAWQLAAAAAVLLELLWVLVAWARRGRRVYLLDFECYRPEDHLKVSYKRFMQGSIDSNYFDQESLDFQEKILYKSALSQETFFPPGLHEDPPVADMQLAREEAEMVMFNAVGDLLKKTGIKPRQVDILVTNCSLFNPTPSLGAMVINHFGMRSDIDSYNLGGMGCSAGVLAIGLAKKLLAERGRGGYALVVSTENITQNWYRGNERSMLVPNTIFRMGGSAMLLTNKVSEKRRAKYELEHLVRVHLGADRDAYECIFQKPDAAGRIGVELSKELVGVASKAMTVNMTRLGPLVLPLSEKLCFAANWVARKVLGLRVAPYIPDFKAAFDHFCLHAGGRGVVEGLSKQLDLPVNKMAPSANTLYWYGNTSSSTVWYSLGFIESVQGVRRGDVVWQIGFGSGFKCNSVVWRALRPIRNEQHRAWQHIKGRENEAVTTLQRIAAQTAAERAAKAAEVAVTDAEAHVTTKPAAATANGQANGDTAPSTEGRRTLRSGKVVG